MQGLTDLTTLSYDNQPLGPGIFRYGIQPAGVTALGASPFVLADFIAGSKGLGAFDSGAKYTPNRKFKTQRGAGSIGKMKNSDRRLSSEGFIELNLVEIGNPDIAKVANPGSIETTVGDFKMLEGGPILSTSYLDNVALITTVKGLTAGGALRYVILWFDSVFAVDTSGVETKDHDEAVTTIKLEARTLTPTSEGWKWYTLPA